MFLRELAILVKSKHFIHSQQIRIRFDLLERALGTLSVCIFVCSNLIDKKMIKFKVTGVYLGQKILVSKIGNLHYRARLLKRIPFAVPCSEIFHTSECIFLVYPLSEITLKKVGKFYFITLANCLVYHTKLLFLN